MGSFNLTNDYGLDFVIYVNDPLFDNDDNPYAEIKLHNYINMDD